jgi:hypothetical protein
MMAVTVAVPMTVAVLMLTPLFMPMFMLTIRLSIERDLHIGAADGKPSDLIDFNIITLDTELFDLIDDLFRIEAQIDQCPDAHVTADSCKAVKV